ncbi:TPA: hypothetical protein N0F65_010866 [Lagenidium giganteum]|uniref:Uncharacterized protein n=1 Tax=Lagenidium giganteum TaxID=4803 RepID=A0AAV2Z792_9STRA|nr:TPA: hypothetical protein N0F65_010866 [Lagenidium giganteum]
MHNNRKQKPGRGYTNLLAHIKSKHTYYAEEVRMSRDGTIVDSAARNAHKWLQWVVSSNLPFSFLDNPMTREHVDLKPVSSKMLRKYLHLVTSKVESKISDSRGDQFGLVLDGATFNSEQFIALFAVNEVDALLVAVSPIVEQERRDHSAKSRANIENLVHEFNAHKKNLRKTGNDTADCDEESVGISPPTHWDLLVQCLGDKSGLGHVDFGRTPVTIDSASGSVAENELAQKPSETTSNSPGLSTSRLTLTKRKRDLAEGISELGTTLAAALVKAAGMRRDESQSSSITMQLQMVELLRETNRKLDEQSKVQAQQLQGNAALLAFLSKQNS